MFSEDCVSMQWFGLKTAPALTNQLFNSKFLAVLTTAASNYLFLETPPSEVTSAVPNKKDNKKWETSLHWREVVRRAVLPVSPDPCPGPRPPTGSDPHGTESSSAPWTTASCSPAACLHSSGTTLPPRMWLHNKQMSCSRCFPEISSG